MTSGQPNHRSEPEVLQHEQQELARSQALSSATYKKSVAKVAIAVVLYLLTRKEWALWTLVFVSYFAVLEWIYADALQWARLRNLRRRIEAMASGQPSHTLYRWWHGTRTAKVQAVIVLALAGIVAVASSGDPVILFGAAVATHSVLGTGNQLAFMHYNRGNKKLLDEMRPRN